MTHPDAAVLAVRCAEALAHEDLDALPHLTASIEHVDLAAGALAALHRLARIVEPHATRELLAALRHNLQDDQR